MIHDIADAIATNIKENLSWADLCVGLVRDINSKSTSGEDVVIPVYFNRGWDACDMSDYLPVVPDDSKASIIYMEIDNEPNVVEVDARGGVTFETDLNVVVWYNANKIDYDIVESDLLLSEVIGFIPKRINGITSYGNVVEVTGAKVRDKAIFNRYSYNDEQQYLMYPYDFFVINITVTYTIPRGCATSVNNTTSCPTKPTFQ